MGSPSRGLLSHHATCVDVIWPHCLILGTEGKTGKSFSFKKIISFFPHWASLLSMGCSLAVESVLLAGVASLLQSTGSSVRGLRTWSARASLLRGLWGLPRPGMEAVPPASAGGFFNHRITGKVGAFLCFCPRSHIPNQLHRAMAG